MSGESEKQSSPEKEQATPARKFSQEQYDMLKRCSKKKDITEWNEWREKHPEEEILLEDADLVGANLQKANLMVANLQEAYLAEANLEKANLSGANLQGTNFELAIVDGSTLITPKAFDRFTNFTGVGLNNARVEPGTKQLLEYNIRRMRWEQWYKGHPKLKSVVKPFWWMSDYGLSTGRIIVTFFGLALIFANVYYWWGRIAPPGIISDLFIETQATGEQVIVQWWLVPLRLAFALLTVSYAA